MTVTHDKSKFSLRSLKCEDYKSVHQFYQFIEVLYIVNLEKKKKKKKKMHVSNLFYNHHSGVLHFLWTMFSSFKCHAVYFQTMDFFLYAYKQVSNLHIYFIFAPFYWKVNYIKCNLSWKHLTIYNLFRNALVISPFCWFFKKKLLCFFNY